MIELSISGNKVKCTQVVGMATNSVLFPEVKVTLGEDWAELSATIVFRNGTTEKSAVLSASGATVKVPWECMEKIGMLKCAAYGVDGNGMTVTTEYTDIGFVDIGASTSAAGSETPTPGLYETVLALATSAESKAEAAEAAANDTQSAAATKAAEAAASASAAAESATTASEAASGIADYATAAAASATAAATSEGAASTSATNAATAKTAAETAQAAAETAKTAAETAQGLAETAKTAAETAKTNSETAETNAETAQAAAEAAQGLAETAQAAAEGAETAAQAAQLAAESAETGAETAEAGATQKASDAEAWAVGKRSGVDVGTTDPTYHNNAKWYKEQASSIVGGDYATKDEAQGYASSAQAAAEAAAASDATTKADAAQAAAILAAASDATTKANAAAAASDPSGTATTAVSTHNSANDAHETLFAAKQDTTDSLTAEETLADGDYFPFYDTSATAHRKTLWSVIKSTLKTANDLIYAPLSHASRHAVGGADPLSLAAIGGSNDNLLINTDFRAAHRIDQLGVSGTISTAGYFLDCWYLVSGTVTLTDNGITLNGTMRQTRETSVGEATTASLDMYDGTATITYDDTNKQCDIVSAGGTIARCKLEKGAMNTLPNDPPEDYGTELAKCQRYDVEYASTHDFTAIAQTLQFTDYGAVAVIHTPVAMRTIPSASFSGLFVQFPSGSAPITAIQVQTASQNAIKLLLTVSGAVNAVGLLSVSNNGYLRLSADL